MLRKLLHVLPLLLLLSAPCWAQTAGWEFPTAATVSVSSSDNGKILGSDNVPGTFVTVTLANPSSLPTGWEMGFSTAGGHGIVVNPPGGIYIFAGQKQLTSFSAPSNTNYEFFTIQSDGTNYRLLSSTATTTLYNGLIGAPGGKLWTYLFSSGYSATGADNGTTITSALTGGATTITLPSTGLIPNGWAINLYANGEPITLNLNGVSGGTLVTPNGGSVTSYTLPGTPTSYALLSFDGSSFRILLAGGGTTTFSVDTASQMAALGALTNNTVVNVRGHSAVGDGGDASYTFSTSACTLNNGAGDGGSQIPPLTGTGCYNLNVPITGVATAVWGVKGDGVTDDTTAFNNAVTWCDGAAPSYRTLLIGAQRIVDNSSPTVTAGCILSGPTGFMPEAPKNNPGAITLPSAILLGAGQTINLNSGTIQYLRIVPASLTPPTSFQDALSKVAGFSGTGITLLDGSADEVIRYVQIIGFNLCIGDDGGTHHGRSVQDHLWLDCTNDDLLDNQHDVAEVSFIRGWQFFNGNNSGVGGNSYALDIENVTGVANNGSGQIRLTIGSTANMATGNTILVRALLGAFGANGVWTVTVVDAQHIDLQGSNFTSTVASGVETSGQAVVTGFSSMQGIWTGEAVTGSGIPANTTVLAVDFINNKVWLSNLATTGGTQSLTFATGTYTSGGNAILDATYRSGYFIKTTNSEENHITDAFEFNWQTGYNPSTGTQWQMFHNVGCDGETRNTNICILVDGNAFRAQFIGVNATGGPAVSFEENTSAAQGTLIRGMYIEGGATTADPRVNVILNTNDNVDFDGHDNGSLQYLANYNSTGHARFSGLFTNTRLLNPSLPVVANTKTPLPLIVGKGTWAPGLTFGGGNTGLTFSQAIGDYDINSDGLATFHFKIALSALGSSTGLVEVTNLPISCPSLNGPGQSGGVVSFFLNMLSTLSSATTIVNGVTKDEINLQANNSGSGNTPQMDNTFFTNSSEVFGNLTCLTR